MNIFTSACECAAGVKCIHIDNIVVASNTWKEHLQSLEAVFTRCETLGIAQPLKRSKCCFASATIEYLGHTVGSGTILPQDTKVEAILNFPLPQTRKQLKSFLGLIGYYRPQIPNFALHSGPLDKVTGKTSPRTIIWTEPMLQAFNSLKAAFKEAPIISAPDMSQPFYLCTDACATGVGATLTQVIDGHTCHIAFFSKRLKKSQHGYSATELEIYAIHLALQHFAAFLHGSFTFIQTDHKP